MEFVDQANPSNTSSWKATDWLQVANADHDPFDVFRRDPLAFRLVPLIYSSGGDERYDLFTARDAWPTTLGGPVTSVVGNVTLGSYRKVTPFVTVAAPDGESFLGAAVDETAADNINNHNIASE